MGRRHDIPIRRREDVPLRRLGDVQLRRCWVFHLRRTCDVTGTYRETSLRRSHDVLLLGGEYLNIIKLYIRDLINNHKPAMELNNYNNNNNNNTDRLHYIFSK